MDSPGASDLRQFLATKGITGSMLAAMAHCSLRTVRNWTSGVATIPPATWELVCIKTAGWPDKEMARD